MSYRGTCPSHKYWIHLKYVGDHALEVVDSSPLPREHDIVNLHILCHNLVCNRGVTGAPDLHMQRNYMGGNALN